MNIYERFGVREVVNARGNFTLAGGTLMEAEVLAAYHQAAKHFVRIDDLQEAAGAVIGKVTGAESGYVTSGAAAAVALATAACLAGLDVEKMARLPDTSEMSNEVLVQRAHRNPYDHMVRAAGARLVEFGDIDSATAENFNDAIGPNTVAAFFDAESEHKGLPFETFAQIARAKGIPTIVDAATALPPPDNLRRFTEAGADLVAFSGGKSIRGPQSSGFLAGRRALLLSVALQHQDMDVRRATWSKRELIDQGIITRPPEQGIGRSMKVGKEEIVALMVALERYVARDHASERRRWKRTATKLAGGLGGIQGLTAFALDGHPNGRRPVPTTVIQVNAEGYGMSATDVVLRLQEMNPIILVIDDEVENGRLGIDCENIRPADISLLASAFRRLTNGDSRSGASGINLAAAPERRSKLRLGGNNDAR